MTALARLPVRRRPKSLTRDVDALHELADRLHGSPIPGVRMTERQFDDWQPQGVRAEWVDGEVTLMTTGSVEHGRLCFWIARLLTEFVEHHDLGEVLSPQSVRYGERRRSRDPDVLFVATSRLHLILDNHVEGPPDLAVEVVSPESTGRDWRTKFHEYAEAGVREYWIVDPLSLNLAIHTLSKGDYKLLTPDASGRVHSKVLRRLYVRREWFFTSPLPRLSKVLKELGIR